MKLEGNILRITMAVPSGLSSMLLMCKGMQTTTKRMLNGDSADEWQESKWNAGW